MRATQSTQIGADKYELTPVGAHPHGMRIYRRLHGHLARNVKDLSSETDLLRALGGLVADDEVAKDLGLLLTEGGLRCNGAEVKNWEEHLFEGRLGQLYELSIWAFKVNYGEVFQGLLGRLPSLAKERNQGESKTPQTSTPSALLASLQGKSASGS